MVNILIFGTKGMLGRYIYEYLKHYYTVTGICREQLDVYISHKNGTLISEIKTIIDTNKPDYVINCYGITNKRPEITITEMFIVNSYFPQILSVICNKNIKLIHPSTDCVFSGTDGYYDNISIPDPYDVYGLSKTLADNINACIIRTSIIGFDLNKRSLLDWVKENEGNTIDGYTNHYWNGITCLEYAKVIREIIEDKIKYWTGIKHIGSYDSVNKYELITMFKNVFGIKVNIVEKKTDKICNRILKPNIVRDKLETQLIELKQFNLSYNI